MNRNMKDALAGVAGGVAYMAGDCLLYVFPGRDAALDVDPVFAAMPVWRFIASAFLGLLGMALMLYGFRSLYAMTKEVCGKKMQRFMVLGGIGVAATALAHFTLGSLVPMTYKAVLAGGGTADMAEKASATMYGWVTPLNVVVIALLYVQFVVLLYMLLSRKSGLSLGYVLVGPFGALAAGVLWYLIFKGTAVEGSWGSCESLGEGLMYLVAYFYWKKQERAAQPGADA